MKAWRNTAVTELLGIEYPIIQGPFGRGGSTSLWAGQAAPFVRYHKAGELFAALVRETDALSKQEPTEANPPARGAASKHFHSANQPK